MVELIEAIRRDRQLKLDQVYIHSHHKCASRWSIEYFSKIACLNGLSFDYKDRTEDIRGITKGIRFFGNSSYKDALSLKLYGLHIVRNPLMIILSAYYSHIATHPVDGWNNLVIQRQLLENSTFDEGMLLTLAFLERADINGETVGPLYALRNWDFADDRFITLRSEDLVAQPSATIKSIKQFSTSKLPDDSDFLFQRFSGGRQPGQQDLKSHYRSGDPNEWRGTIPKVVVEYCRKNFSQMLLRFYPEILSV